MDALYVVLILILLSFLIPVKYDPAIRLREWLNKEK